MGCSCSRLYLQEPGWDSLAEKWPSYGTTLLENSKLDVVAAFESRFGMHVFIHVWFRTRKEQNNSDLQSEKRLFDVVGLHFRFGRQKEAFLPYKSLTGSQASFL